MLQLSRVLGRPVRDAGGEEIATLEDLVGRWQPDHGLIVSGLVARVGRRPCSSRMVTAQRIPSPVVAYSVSPEQKRWRAASWLPFVLRR